jgi:hypothetical protein
MASPGWGCEGSLSLGGGGVKMGEYIDGRKFGVEEAEIFLKGEG